MQKCIPENVRSIQIAKFLFSDRRRLLDVKASFGNMYKETASSPMLFVAKFEDLFSSPVEDQLRVALILEEIYSRRREKTK